MATITRETLLDEWENMGDLSAVKFENGLSGQTLGELLKLFVLHIPTPTSCTPVAREVSFTPAASDLVTFLHVFTSPGIVFGGPQGGDSNHFLWDNPHV